MVSRPIWLLLITLVFTSAACVDYGVLPWSDLDGGPGELPDPDAPYVLGGHCEGRRCSLEHADATFEGEDGQAMIGWSVAMAGDVDGDGYDDMLIGGPGDDRTATGVETGVVYLVYGGPQFSQSTMLQQADAAFVVTQRAQRLGFSVAGAGDVNGDGLADMLFGAPGPNEGDRATLGATYLVPGRAERYQGEVVLDGNEFFGQLELNDGQTIGSAGNLVASTGDLDGDGLGEFLVGAFTWRENDSPGLGAFYLVRGEDARSQGVSGQVWLDEVAHLIVNTTDASRMGQIGAGPGDLDGDGLADLLLWDYSDTNEPGDRSRVYLQYGQAEPLPVRMTKHELSADFSSSTDPRSLGAGISGVGDLDADGYADFVLGAPWDRDLHGAVWVVYGRPERFSGPVELDGLGHLIRGPAESEIGVGKSVASAGDLNGDGYDDLLVGDDSYATTWDQDHERGAVHLFLGGPDRLPADQDLMDSDLRFVAPGSVSPCSGQNGSAVAGGGDVDGDGYDDFLIGAVTYCASHGERSGKVYLILGAP